jgi:hypothetical protein
MVRDDLSDRLIHLTKGHDAENNFISILNGRTLVGGSGYIKGNHKCICFTEAPVSKLPQILATTHDDIRYRPYGFIFTKKWIFSKGGRPAIYQPSWDYSKLPRELEHLHVRFELSDTYCIDHTWEREWRIKADLLAFEPDDVTLLVPTRESSDFLRNHWTKEPWENPAVGYPWHHLVLEDLGVQISA